MGSVSEDEDEYGKGGAVVGGSASSVSRCEWHPSTVSKLLESYGDKCATIKGYLKIKDWDDIVRTVNVHCDASNIAPKTMKQCRDKVENLKRRYKLEKRRATNRGLSSVHWSFFHKLDEIMAMATATATGSDKATSLLEACQSSFELNQGVDCELPEGFAGESMPPPPLMSMSMSMSDMVLSVFAGADRGKGLVDNTGGVDCTLDDILNNVCSYSSKNNRRLDFQDSSSPEKQPPPKRKKSSASNSPSVSKKRKGKSTNPIQSLADALVGFSEVYARIEIAKMEMFTKLVLELAKLRTKRKKRSRSPSIPSDPK